MKSKTIVWVFLGILFLALIGNSFLTIGDIGKDNSLYQYAGNSALTKQGYLGQSNICLPDKFYYENQITDTTGKINSDSIIHLPRGQFRFVVSDIRQGNKIQGVNDKILPLCSSIFYEVNVFKNGFLLETIKYPQQILQECSDYSKGPITKTYTDGVAKINATFGFREDIGGGDVSHCGVSGAVMVNKYDLIYPDDVLELKVTKTEVIKDNLQVTVSANSKYQALSGNVGVNFIAPSVFGSNTNTVVNPATFSQGSIQTFTFTTKINGNGSIAIQPFYKVYASTSNLNNLFGDNIFDDNVDSLNSASHQKYLVKDFTYNPQVITIGEGNTAVTYIINETYVNNMTSQTQQSQVKDKTNSELVIAMLVLVFLVVIAVIYFRGRKKR